MTAIITTIPTAANPERRSVAARSLSAFLTTYFPDEFTSEWTVTQQRLLAAVEKATQTRSREYIEVNRGEGTTTIILGAALWSVVTEQSAFTLLITGSQSLAEAAVGWLIHQLSDNTLLLDDFPETCLPFRQQGDNRGRRVVYNESNVAPVIGRTWLRIAEIKGHRPASVIRACPITTSFLGLAESLPRVTRPALVLLDDPAGCAPDNASSHRRIDRAVSIVPRISTAGFVMARVA